MLSLLVPGATAATSSLEAVATAAAALPPRQLPPLLSLQVPALLGPPYKSIIQIQKVEKSAGFFCGQKYSIDKRITNRTIGWAGLISAVV